MFGGCLTPTALQGSVVFLSHSRHIPEQYRTLDHDSFLPNIYQSHGIKAAEV
jgi:hypothetical protein